MIGPLQSLQKLESLAKQTAEALHRVSTENRSLREKLLKIESEHKRAKEELREAKMTLARHDRLKARLVKLSEKLERLG
jgi:chromosome condensin MukBEF ATPase and DNA-binding subunit MukB